MLNQIFLFLSKRIAEYLPTNIYYFLKTYCTYYNVYKYHIVILISYAIMYSILWYYITTITTSNTITMSVMVIMWSFLVLMKDNYG